jgi:hypothetical protein
MEGKKTREKKTASYGFAVIRILGSADGAGNA